MSKARQLANLLSNSADLSDGASTGGEFKFEASGSIEANKPLIKKSDNTVEQIKVTAVTTLTALTTPAAAYDLSSQKLLDVLLDGDYVFAVIENATGTTSSTIRLNMYSVGVDNTLTLQQSTAYSQFYVRGVGHRAWITKTSTTNKYVLSIFDSDETAGDGRIRYIGIVNNLDGSFSYSLTYGTTDASTVDIPRNGARPVQMGDYVVIAVVGQDNAGYHTMYSIDTSPSGTALSLAETANVGQLYYDVYGSEQKVIVKISDTVGYIVGSTYTSLISESFNLSSTGQITDGSNYTFDAAGLLISSTYDDFDVVWSTALNSFVVVTNNATTTRIAIYNSSFSFVHARDYPVGGNDEFYRSLQVDESTGRIYVYTGNATTHEFNLITAFVANNKVLILDSETITHTYTGSQGIPVISLDSANGKLVYCSEANDPSTGTESLMAAFATAASSTSTNYSSGSFVGFSKESASDGEYVTVAINGGTVSLSDLTGNTIYYVNPDGTLTSVGEDEDCVGKALTTTDLRIDTGASAFYNLVNPDTSGIVTPNEYLVANSGGNVIFPDSEQIQLGTNNDAQIYHNGSNFYLNNVTGSTYLMGDVDTFIQGSTITLETNLGENALYYSGTSLYGYYNGSQRFVTTIDGVDITGDIRADSYVETLITYSGTVLTLNCAGGNAFVVTLASGNATVAFSNPPISGNSYTMSIELIQDAAGSGYTVTWPASVIWPNGTAPTLTSTASAKDVFVFTTRDGGTTWLGFTAGQALA